MTFYQKRTAQFLPNTNGRDKYSCLLSRCVKTAIKLREFGIRSGDIVSTCTLGHENSCIPFIAAQFLGAISANFDPNLSHLDTTRLLKLVQPKILFVSLESLAFMEKCIDAAKIQTQVVVFGKSRKYCQFSEFLEATVTSSGEGIFTPYQIKNDKDTAVILFSSGTTGFPKGICLSHHTLLREAETHDILNLKNGEQAVLLLFTTLYWISGVVVLIRSILSGAARVVYPTFDAVKTWQFIETYQVTMIFLAPYHARDFIDIPPRNKNVSSLELFFTGSCPVTKDLMENLKEGLPSHTKVLHGYGLSEAGGMVTLFNPRDPAEVNMQNRKPQSCGRMRTGFSWKIVDIFTEETLGPNQEGELRIKSDVLMNGYYRRESASAYDSEGYLKSGDIAYYDEEQCFYIVDRIKEMFKYRGWHILPAIIEEVLMNHPAVKEAAVVGIPHEIDGAHPMGVVVLYKQYDISPEEIEKYVEQRVGESQRLRGGVKVVKELIRTAIGKLKRNEMKNILLRNEI